jgi:hypothetical protein
LLSIKDEIMSKAQRRRGEGGRSHLFEDSYLPSEEWRLELDGSFRPFRVPGLDWRLGLLSPSLLLAKSRHASEGGERGD